MDKRQEILKTIKGWSIDNDEIQHINELGNEGNDIEKLKRKVDILKKDSEFTAAKIIEKNNIHNYKKDVTNKMHWETGKPKEVSSQNIHILPIPSAIISNKYFNNLNVFQINLKIPFHFRLYSKIIIQCVKRFAILKNIKPKRFALPIVGVFAPSSRRMARYHTFSHRCFCRYLVLL